MSINSIVSHPAELTAGLRSASKIWIDLDNTPHVPFFRPIIRELEALGIPVVLTARDAFQVCELASEFGLEFKAVGRHAGKNKWMKVLGLFQRAAQLVPFVRQERPALAVSHGARAQMLIANLAGIPTVMIDDYEHSQHVPLATPKWAILPEILARQGSYCHRARIRTYPGMKEDVYTSDFTPKSHLENNVPVDPNDLLVTIRPPATVAHYHNAESEDLLAALMTRLEEEPCVSAVLLPRNRRQELELRNQFPRAFERGKAVVPQGVVDGLNLIWHSDLVVSGGGTMNREAAALGVPVYSIFRGPVGAIDRWLQEQGRLLLIQSCDEVRHRIRLERRRKEAVRANPKPALGTLVKHLAQILLAETGGLACERAAAA
jgi:uncharacterized protein